MLLITRTDSPLKKVCVEAVNVMTFSAPPELNEPILLIPVGLCLTVKVFSELESDPGSTTRDAYSVTVPA